MAKKFDLDGTSVENVTPEAPMQIESPTVETPLLMLKIQRMLFMA